MAKKNIIAVAMSGMNRGSQGDSSHPFPVEDLIKKYPVLWLPQVSPREKRGMTLFYEQLITIDSLCQKQSIDPANVRFIFGRGTIGQRTERGLADALQKCSAELGKDSFKVILAKSFGVVDSLRALKLLSPEAEEKIGRINLMFCIDGNSTLFSRRSVSRKIKIGKKRESRFIIPSCVDKAFGIVQRSRGIKGLKIGNDKDPRIDNFVVKQSYVDSFGKVYDRYADGFVRELAVRHFNMDEIAAVIPCCRKKSDGRNYNLVSDCTQGYYEDFA